MTEILNGPSFSRHDNPKKLIFMLHGYGDNAANFMNLAHPIDQEEWQAAYIALNAPGVISGNYMGYQWFDLYPNGVYIADAGPIPNAVQAVITETAESLLTPRFIKIGKTEAINNSPSPAAEGIQIKSN